MKKILSTILAFWLVFSPVMGYAQDAIDLSILDEEDYSVLQIPQAEPSVSPEPMGDYQLMQFTEQFWRDAVRSIDGEDPLSKEVPPAITSLRPSISLPLQGTNISLTGKQTFGFKLDSRQYKNENKNAATKKSFSTFSFEQQMQIKMQGKIVDRIFVDIDYDNQDNERQDISIAYRGKEGELVQEAEFGDVQLSLPQTEFISFNKQLFGAKMHLQHKNANLRLIGSQTKGTSKNKQFQGSSVFETMLIKDVSYIRRAYYDVTQMLLDTDPNYSFLRYQIAKNTEVVYLSDGKSASRYRYENLEYADFADPTDVKTGQFRLLERGVDYAVDYSTSNIIFKGSLAEADAVVIDYVNTAGQRLSEQAVSGIYARTYKTLKLEGDKPVSPARASLYTEVKTVYNIGRQQITRDDGKGNFTLVLQDANGNNISAQENQVYPSQITVDFEKGTFRLQRKLTEASVYNNTPVSQRNLTFRVELNSKVKSYFVESNMVVQSETVKINGLTLKRNDDYYIDYSSGFLTFYKEGMINESSLIDVTYDTEGGDSADVTLLGARFDYNFTDKIAAGATVLQEGGSQPDKAPNIGALNQSLTVYEADIKAKDLNVTEDFKVSAAAEAAKSVRDKNLFGYAVVENFDDTKQLTGGSVVYRDWQIASNPGGANSYWFADNSTQTRSIQWDTQNISSLEINPSAASSAGDKQDVLLINYDFTKSDEVSIVFPLSANGADLSQKTMFELTALGNANGPQINVDFGNIDEVSDSGVRGESISCSKYYPNNVPKTEDKYCRGTVSPEEDKGWTYVDPDNTPHPYDPFATNVFNKDPQPNGRLDTQDLDGNGRLDAGDSTIGGSFGYATTNTRAIDGLNANQELLNTTWKTYTTQLNLSDAEKPYWTSVKHLRITLRRGPSTNPANPRGTIKIANIGISGNSWTPDKDTSKITAINKTDNTDYVPIFDDVTGSGREVFNYLYGSLDALRSESRNQNIFEQALAFYYDSTAVTFTEMTANRNFSSMDFTTHKELRFLLFSKEADTDGAFIMRLGTDTNYHEIAVSLDMPVNQWNLIKLKLTDSNGDGILDKLEPITSGVTVNIVTDATSPAPVNFQKISKIVTGVKKTGGAGKVNGQVWLNEVHMASSNTAEGYAYRGEVKMQLNGWGEAGASYKNVDDQFETPVTVATNQKQETQDYFVNLTKINYMPVKATYSRTTVDTIALLDDINTNTVRALDKGVVNKQMGAIRADYTKPEVPKVSLEYSFDRADYELAEREDARDTYSASVSHSLPTGNFLRSASAGYTNSKNDINYSANMLAGSALYYDTQEQTRRMNAKLSFEPWRGSSITPSYSLTTVKEDRSDIGVPDISYNKGMQQQAGLTANFRITKWLMPAMSYNVNTYETNNLTKTTLVANGVSQDFEVGEIKNINRSADGGLSLTLNFRDIVPKSKLLSTLVISSSYRLQDADSYVNVEDSFDSKSSLWVRSGLDAKNPYSYRRNMTERDTLNSSQRWTPFKEYNWKGAMSPFGTMSFINNFTKTFQTTEETGTETDSTSTTLPDVVMTISELEKFYAGTYWLTSASLKLRFNQINNEIAQSSLKKEINYGAELRFMLIQVFDTALIYSHNSSNTDDLVGQEVLENIEKDEYSAQTSFYIKRLRITPKLTYADSRKMQRMGIVTEQYTDISPSINCRLDFSMPGGMWLPFVNRNYATTNRIIWNSNLIYQQRRSDYVVLENKNYYEANTSFDYEFSKNLRLTLSGALQMLDHQYVQSESYVGYNVGTMMTLQF